MKKNFQHNTTLWLAYVNCVELYHGLKYPIHFTIIGAQYYYNIYICNIYYYNMCSNFIKWFDYTTKYLTK